MHKTFLFGVNVYIKRVVRRLNIKMASYPWDSWCQGTATASTFFTKLAVIGAGNPPALWGRHPTTNNIDLNYFSKTCALIDNETVNDLYRDGLHDGSDKYIFVKVVDFSDTGKCAVARGRGSYDKNHFLIFSGKKVIIAGVIHENVAAPVAANYLGSLANQLQNM